MQPLRRGPTRHLFADADPPDIDPITGVRWCKTCNLPDSNAIHNLPERSEDEKAVEARRIGERA